MPKSQRQKSKLLYLVDILMHETDEEHALSTKEIIARLDDNDIHADRKTIYADMEELVQYGYDIIGREARNGGGYYLASRDFEPAELKLLVDAVQASRFITEKKSRELIKKLEGLTSKYEAVNLTREVYVSDRAKAENKAIYYSVDAIHTAIRDNKQLSFTYLIWTPKRELVAKHEGKITTVSPWSLLWQDDNYYLVAFDEDAGEIKHYRVDKMDGAQVLDKKRNGRDVFKNIDMGKYSSKNFGMFHGEEETVSLELPNELAGVIIDRFGKDASLKVLGGDTFTARINVFVSQQFFGWVLGLGPKVRITAPLDVVKEYKKFLESNLDNYR